MGDSGGMRGGFLEREKSTSGSTVTWTNMVGGSGGGSEFG